MQTKAKLVLVYLRRQHRLRQVFCCRKMCRPYKELKNPKINMHYIDEWRLYFIPLDCYRNLCKSYYYVQYFARHVEDIIVNAF